MVDILLLLITLQETPAHEDLVCCMEVGEQVPKTTQPQEAQMEVMEQFVLYGGKAENIPQLKQEMYDGLCKNNR